VAALLGELMAALGYERYALQGGDWGAPISFQLAHQAPERVAALHLNAISVLPAPADLSDPPLSEAEQEFIQTGLGWRATQGHHLLLHGAAPDAVSTALADSPAGLACTDFDDQNRIQGSLELPLNERGQQQVHALVEQLREYPLEVIYTSDAEPALSTAQTLGSELGVTVKTLEGLENLDHGLWEGLQVDDIRHKYPKVFRQWQESPETICPPEGETISDALERVRKALRKPLRKKDCFAVVLPEPLATLVSCQFQNRKPEVPESRDGTCGARVEVLQLAADLTDESHSEVQEMSSNGEAVPEAGALARGDHSR
jgi:probable phosphoglycerate mutase